MKLLILTVLLFIPFQTTFAIFAGLSAYYFTESLIHFMTDQYARSNH